MAPVGDGKVTVEDRARYKRMFQEFDINNDGVLEVSELAEALKVAGSETDHEDTAKARDLQSGAKAIIKRADLDSSHGLDLEEFIAYMQKHEAKLYAAFSKLDKDKDGIVVPSEVKECMGTLGVTISLKDAEALTKRIHKGGNITWPEWRDYFLFELAENLNDLVTVWHGTLMVCNGDTGIPVDFTKREKKSGLWWRNLCAGAIAGIISKSATAPMDRVKTMLQVHGPSGGGLVGTVKAMLTEGGVKSLWRGNGVSCLKIAPDAALKFAFYEQFKKMITDDESTITPVQRFVAGSTAGVTAQCVVFPLDVIKTRLAISKSGQYKGILDCGLHTLKSEGFFSLYRGCLANMMGIIPMAGIDLTVYEMLKDAYRARNPDVQEMGALIPLACGSISSSCGQVVAYPMFLLKVRVQSGTIDEKNIFRLAGYIAKKEGLKGFYRGFLPHMMKSLPSISLGYAIYERARQFLYSI